MRGARESFLLREPMNGGWPHIPPLVMFIIMMRHVARISARMRHCQRWREVAHSLLYDLLHCLHIFSLFFGYVLLALDSSLRNGGAGPLVD